MNTSATSINYNSDSIDFFEDESCPTKQKQSDSSKIVTKAVIETAPALHLSADDKNQLYHRLDDKERLSQYHKQSDYLSSPSSSLERKLLGLDDAALETLMNCLAYSDERFDNTFSISPDSFDLKESLDNSLTDSTVTIITSDFTSISSLSNSSSCNSLPNDHGENSLSDCNAESDRQPTDSEEDIKQDESSTNEDVLDQLQETDELNSLKGNTGEPGVNDQKLESQDEDSDLPEAYESDFESDNEIKYLEGNCKNGNTEVESGEQIDSHPDKESYVSNLEDDLGDISITQSRSSSIKTSYKKNKNLNLTFSREEIIKIERDNLILLKKIMTYSKQKPVSLNQQPFCHKKTSTAINRAKMQKKIEQDNYILYSKISAMSRFKRVF